MAACRSSNVLEAVAGKTFRNQHHLARTAFETTSNARCSIISGSKRLPLEGLQDERPQDDDGDYPAGAGTYSVQFVFGALVQAFNLSWDQSVFGFGINFPTLHPSTHHPHFPLLANLLALEHYDGAYLETVGIGSRRHPGTCVNDDDARLGTNFISIIPMNGNRSSTRILSTRASAVPPELNSTAVRSKVELKPDAPDHHRRPIAAASVGVVRVLHVYDYIFIDSGSPDSYLSADVGSIVNETFLNVSSRALENATDLGPAGIGLNGTDTVEPLADVIVMAVTSLVLGLMILVTVIGNDLRCQSRRCPNTRTLVSTSPPPSIFTRRYWAVTNIDYIHSRTSRRVFTMIFLVWFASVIVSLAPQFGWKDPEYLERIEQQKCMVSQNIAYQVFATCCTFYVPLFVILVLYWKIYQTARRRIHRRAPKLPATPNSSNQEETPKPKSKIRFHLKKKFTNPSKSAVSSLGLVEGNSTNTVNTVEDTEDSANHQTDGRKPGLETTFSGDEVHRHIAG
ncbi:hypothetical protein AND_004642 [Anopheles darlingi]|uniref:G-protein coupled receptors family 1 profile domain-containing protein n=1 Tax=Anopheles darlingi TaxID=43151 RepID=W5JK01_ANODA|nr:hypothetical protein AND_004642 [Anopheles darlingi]